MPHFSSFVKMQGLGNDFVIFKMDDLQGDLNPTQIRHLCDRHLGIGCDQLIVLEPCEKADIFMHIYNPDGSRAGACGNATRCVAELVFAQTGKTNDITIQTDFDILHASQVSEAYYRVNMGKPHIFTCDNIADARAQFNLPEAICVDVGNPHCVFFMDYAPNDETLTKMGRVIETHKAFPNRTNVEFAVLQDDGSIRMRVWERGAGITNACGSGACATAVAAISAGYKEKGSDIPLILDGGTLTINWPSENEGVYMSGAVAYVFKGEVEI
jgi:diaminopimelate epimerase